MLLLVTWSQIHVFTLNARQYNYCTEARQYNYRVVQCTITVAYCGRHLSILLSSSPYLLFYTFNCYCSDMTFLAFVVSGNHYFSIDYLHTHFSVQHLSSCKYLIIIEICN